VFAAFAVLTILLTVMGLYGMAYFTAKQRTREVGIRRVMGASVMDIIRRLNSEFAALLLIALLVAFPLAYFAIGSMVGDLRLSYRDLSAVVHRRVDQSLLTLVVTVLTSDRAGVSCCGGRSSEALRHEVIEGIPVATPPSSTAHISIPPRAMVTSLSLLLVNPATR
jgi:ABC-type antimicrobial peptide transport system permease subunit